MNGGDGRSLVHRLDCPCDGCRAFAPRVYGSAVPGDPLGYSGTTRLLHSELSNLTIDRHRSRLSVRWVTRGTYTYEVDGRRYVLRPGNFLVLDDGQTYNSTAPPGPPTPSFTVSFDPALTQDVVTSLARPESWRLENPHEVDTAARPAFLTSTHPVTGAFRTLLTDLAQIGRGGFSNHSIEESFYRLGVELVASHNRVRRSIDAIAAGKQSTREELYARLCRARDLIHAHADRPLSIEAMAAEACLSPFHFMRTFKQAFGRSPHQYLLDLRLEKAFELMSTRRDRLPLRIIAIDCGFEDLSAFSKAFKQKFGFSPGKFPSDHKPA